MSFLSYERQAIHRPRLRWWRVIDTAARIVVWVCLPFLLFLGAMIVSSLHSRGVASQNLVGLTPAQVSQKMSGLMLETRSQFWAGGDLYVEEYYAPIYFPPGMGVKAWYKNGACKGVLMD
jgi:hypothetical protein